MEISQEIKIEYNPKIYVKSLNNDVEILISLEELVAAKAKVELEK